MIMIYAEQFLKAAGKNQWFVQFHTADPSFDSSLHQQQIQWFESQGLTLTQVQTVGQIDSLHTGFYHVSFAGAEDIRLAAYSGRFEDSEGNSLDEHTYQMFEWSYDGWINSGGPSAFDEFVAQTQQVPAAGAVTGPQGP